MRAREFEDISRRNLLKGAGAAALAGSGVGAKAKSYDDMDQLIQDKGLAPKPAPEAPDELGDFIKTKMGQQEREQLIALFSQDTATPPASPAPSTPPGDDKRNTGPDKIASAKMGAKPDQRPTATTATKPSAKQEPNIVIAKKNPLSTVKNIIQPSGSIPWLEVKKYLTSKMSPAHALGVLVNMWAESNLIPSRYNPNDRGGPSGGLLQWHDDQRKGEHRFSDMARVVPNWQNNWKGQLDYAFKEPEGRAYLSQQYPDSALGAVQASWWWTTNWERPKDKHIEKKKRTSSAMGRTFISAK
jgi:hypothetical protein